MRKVWRKCQKNLKKYIQISIGNFPIYRPNNKEYSAILNTMMNMEIFWENSHSKSSEIKRKRNSKVKSIKTINQNLPPTGSDSSTWTILMIIGLISPVRELLSL